MLATYPLDVCDKLLTMIFFSDSPSSIPERELENRVDLRASRVFSIDPDTARDLDDALSIKTNDDGTLEVGVHIADVAFFVKPNTPLDRDARKKATSVYLVQRAVPMLPPALSEQLCSLLPGQDRLAFSVIFTFDSNCKAVDKKFVRSIIRSSAKLGYSDAQRVIDGETLGNVSVDAAHKPSEIERDIRTLAEIARNLRHQRFQSGALSLDQPTLKFQLDENGLPIDCDQISRQEANTLIEEVRVDVTNSIPLLLNPPHSLCCSLISVLRNVLQSIFQNKHSFGDTMCH